MCVASSELPRSAGRPFYEGLNRVLDEAGFDVFVEEQCATFYADGVGLDHQLGVFIIQVRAGRPRRLRSTSRTRSVLDLLIDLAIPQ